MPRYLSLALLLFVLTPTLALAQTPTSIDKAVGRYQEDIAAVEQTRLDASMALKAQYTTALERLKAGLDPGADVEALLAVAAEIEALKTGEAVTAGTPNAKLLAARKTYKASLAKIQQQADAKVVYSTEKAIADLRKLTGSLAAKDDLDGALAAEQQRRKLESNESYLAAKQRIAMAPAPEPTRPSPSRSDDLRNAIPRNGLIGYFPFDGRLEDTKGSVPLQLSGGRRFASGKSGRALNIEKPSEGKRPVISFPLPDGGKSDFSVSYCVRPVLGAHSQKVIFSAGKPKDRTPFWVSYKQRGGIGAELGFNPPGDGYHKAHASLPRPEPEWHHVVITVTEEESCYYLDGHLMVTMKPSDGAKINLTGMTAYIGTFRDWHGSGKDRYLSESDGPNMLVDELAIYDRAISASDARSLAKNYGLYDDAR